VGEPVYAPDVNAYLVVLNEALGLLAEMEYDSGAAAKWKKNARTLRALLLSELWTDDGFAGKNAYTGELSAPDDSASLVPFVLGDALPAFIVAKLKDGVTPENADTAPGLLIVSGLYDAGEREAAKEYAEDALERARLNGVGCPFYGASLLALAHKAL
jgi:hypothetical protein